MSRRCHIVIEDAMSLAGLLVAELELSIAHLLMSTRRASRQSPETRLNRNSCLYRNTMTIATRMTRLRNSMAANSWVRASLLSTPRKGAVVLARVLVTGTVVTVVIRVRVPRRAEGSKGHVARDIV